MLAELDIDFDQLHDLLYSPYLEDQRSELPEQYRLIGFAVGRLTTFVVEYRVDEMGEYIWVVARRSKNSSAEAMSSESSEIKDVEEIAQQAHLGADVSEHFTGHFQAKQQINLALPLELLRSIDAECQRQKIDRQEWIKLICAEKIREVHAGRISEVV